MEKILESREHLRERLLTVKDRVKWLLINYPATKGDDRILFLEYFKVFEPIFVYHRETQLITLERGLTYDEFLRLTSFETLRRTRQKLQEEEKKKMDSGQEFDMRLLPTEKTMIKRSIREQDFRALMPGDNLETGEYYE